MSNLVNHAKKELEIAGLFGDKDFYKGHTGNAVLELVEVFANQGHTGMSASIVASIFKELVDFKPISPITANDSEWAEYSDGQFQNNRIPAVFKDGKDGRPYYLDAIVWRDGSFPFTGTVDGITSRQYIKLPFMPKTFYVDVDADQNILDKSQLDEAFKYYDKYE